MNYINELPKYWYFVINDDITPDLKEYADNKYYKGAWDCAGTSHKVIYADMDSIILGYNTSSPSNHCVKIEPDDFRRLFLKKEINYEIY